MRRLWLALTLAVMVVPSVAVAQDDEILLERVRGAGEPQVCDTFHTMICEYRHYSGMEETPAGTIVRLDGQPYALVWKGNAYYLESGIILHPTGSAVPGLAGQQWVEAYPNRGRTLASQTWRDLDADGLLSPTDTLVFAGGLELEVKDVRFNLLVKPLAGPR